MSSTNKAVEMRGPQLSEAKSSYGRSKPNEPMNEDCEVIDYGPRQGLDINASSESNRTANSSEPFVVDRKYKVDEANQGFNADEILKRYEEIVNNDSQSQFKFCKNGRCSDCNNVTIMNSTETPICLTFHNFKEDFEDIRSMERMLQNTTSTSLDNNFEVIEKVCFRIQDEPLKLCRQMKTTTECVRKVKTQKKKKKKLIKGRKFWPHHKKNK
ncbi:uncharacterized protein LOC111053345 [Nilaparvata lugens]|uniref:uncharacterized protein LOC111053345 n=1 Tax=Nilaparvata lugens TaxID=108931 RepID=UPI00193D1845|nr:uncharacterized protein LOC111053345 [Nilaparvata lugens]XP_039283241.1 uncharacterized protein LOC111053345 [Nilaparvata lugens]XP_039283242.1 uncharacterized protein LOC111053345 [Nilaparvata lugens]